MEKLKDFIDNNLFSISYLGISDDRITDQLIGLASSYSSGESAMKKISKKVSLLIAESFQNIIRHGSKENSSSSDAREKDYFQIDFLEDRILLSSKNLILNRHVVDLSNKIDKINGLSNAELKQIWVDCINHGVLSDKGGAGLGIVEMARKSQLPLQKSFVKLNEEYSQFFFGIEILVGSENSEAKLDLSKIIELHETFITNGQLLQYRGDFNEDTNPMIIEMLHNNFIDESNIDSVMVENVTIMIETIQNISKHSDLYKGKHNGEFSVFNSNNSFKIKCQNFVHHSNFEFFKSELGMIKSKSIEELKMDRKMKMIEAIISEEGDGGLGLLEIAIFTNNEFNYSFEKVDEDFYLYTLDIKMK